MSWFLAGSAWPLVRSASRFLLRLSMLLPAGHRGRRRIPGGWRNQPDIGAVGLWTTLGDLVRFARAVSTDRSVQMLQWHLVEPRMDSGVFLTSSQDGIRWWSHSGSVSGYECLLASTDSFSVTIMTNDSNGEDLVTEVFRHVAVTHGPGPAVLTNLFGESIETWIEMTADQGSAVGTYVVPWGAEVHVTAPIGQYGPELHLTLPDQEPVWLLRWHLSMAGPGACRGRYHF